MNNRQDDPRDKSFGFKYVDQILDQTNDLIRESKGDYSRICFGLAYVASSIALDQNKKIPLTSDMITIFVLIHLNLMIPQNYFVPSGIPMRKDSHLCPVKT